MVRLNRTLPSSIAEELNQITEPVKEVNLLQRLSG